MYTPFLQTYIMSQNVKHKIYHYIKGAKNKVLSHDQPQNIIFMKFVQAKKKERGCFLCQKMINSETSCALFQGNSGINIRSML